ncbi:MAG: hypothetical protein LBN30_09685 [Oscillospiraceae bacterium]|jgi:hypothetical protein|nr:hypothetical protein [Oscillospiraceae bacterium]
MKRIVLLSGAYVRDTQAYTSDPDAMNEESAKYNPKWEDDFRDFHGDIFLGVYDADSEDDIRRSAAMVEQVHGGVLELIEIEQ